MADYKKVPTRYPNIFEYETKKGKRYNVRLGYTVRGEKKEFNKMGIKTISEAKSILRNAEDKIENQEIGLLGNKKITVAEYYLIFREDKLNSNTWNKTSLVGYDSAFNVHILPYFGARPLSSIDRVDYQAFINLKLNEQAYSVESVRTINNAFMSLLNHAVIVGVIERNRMKRMKISKEDYRPQKKHLTLDEYDVFMQTADELIKDNMQFCMFYLTTFGLRRGEIMGLTPKNIRFKEDTGQAMLVIEKTRTLAYPEGKGTKNASSERMIPLDVRATELIEYVIHEATEIKKDFGQILHQDDFIFINQSNGEPFHVTHLNVLMDRISRKCGIKCSPHMMRHTFATVARTEGVDARMVADFLGHKNISMTDHYTHRTVAGMDKVIQLVNKKLH